MQSSLPYTVKEVSGGVVIEVRQCPVINHLRANGREIVPSFCRHCYYLGDTRASAAGLDFRLEEGNGSCQHSYTTKNPTLPPHDFTAIKEVTLC